VIRIRGHRTSAAPRVRSAGNAKRVGGFREREIPAPPGSLPWVATTFVRRHNALHHGGPSPADPGARARVIQAKGIDTRIENGTVYVSRKSFGLPLTPRRGDFGGSDLMPLREAIRAGHIEVNG
jgi:hypothetical protein